MSPLVFMLLVLAIYFVVRTYVLWQFPSLRYIDNEED